MPTYRDTVVSREPIVPLGGFKLKPTVLLGYTDIAAGGIRALLGINLRKEFYRVDIPQLSDQKLACESLDPLDPRDQAYSPVQIWNLKYEQFSIILVNTLLPPDKCHYVCSKVMDLCTDSYVKKLVILSALRVDLPVAESHDLYENTIYDMPLTSLPCLPEEARINDAFLNTIIQMIRVEYIPSSILIAPSHRVSLGQASDRDSSKRIITLLQCTLNKVTKISFDQEFSLHLVYKGDNTKNKDGLNMMYS